MSLSSTLKKVTTVFTDRAWWGPQAEDDQKDTVGYVSPWFRYHEWQWQTSRRLVEGTRALLADSEAYVPKFVNEQSTEDGGDLRYEQRLKGGVLFNGYERSIEGFTGLAFKKLPQLERDVPPGTVKDWEFMSVDGLHGTEILRHAYEDAMAMGSGGMLIDYLADPGDSLFTEEQRGGRPFWDWIAVDRVTNIDRMWLRGERVLSLLVVKDVRWERGFNSFKGYEVTYYRVWRLIPGPTPETDVVRWERWRKRVDGTKVEYDQLRSGVVGNQTRIPFVPLVLGRGKHFFYRAPTFWPLAEMNLRHFLTDIAYHWNLHMQGYGIIVRIGAEPDDNGIVAPIYLGPGGVVDVGVGGDVKIIAPPADAFTHQRTALRDDETRMGALGMSFLQPDLRMSETATAKELDMGAQYATLEMSLRKLKDTGEWCLYFHHKYRDPGVADNGGSLLFPVDALSRGLDPALLQALSTLEEKRQLPLRTLLQVIRDGKVPEDLDVDSIATELLAERVKDEKKMLELIKSKPTPANPNAPKKDAPAPAAPKDSAA